MWYHMSLCSPAAVLCITIISHNHLSIRCNTVTLSCDMSLSSWIFVVLMSRTIISHAETSMAYRHWAAIPGYWFQFRLQIHVVSIWRQMEVLDDKRLLSFQFRQDKVTYLNQCSDAAISDTVMLLFYGSSDCWQDSDQSFRSLKY